VKRWVADREIERVFDAAGIDELLGGPPAEAGVYYAVLHECARGEAGRCFGALRRVAARRRVAPTYLVDRATVLLAVAEARRESDLYRILGVLPLASPQEIRAHWREVAKAVHPDHAGGSNEQFQAIKRAYDVLGTPRQRVEYEQQWRLQLAPIERARTVASKLEVRARPGPTAPFRRGIRAVIAWVRGRSRRTPQEPPHAAEAPAGHAVELDGARAGEAMVGPVPQGNGTPAGRPAAGREEPAPEVNGRGAVAPEDTTHAVMTAHEPADEPTHEPGRLEEDMMQDMLRRTDAMFEAMRGIDQRLASAGLDGVSSVTRMFEQLHTALQAIELGEIDATLADIDRARRDLDVMSRELTQLRQLKVSLGDGVPAGH
jgi:hypothetical protein